MFFAVETEDLVVTREFFVRASRSVGLALRGSVRVRKSRGSLVAIVSLFSIVPPIWRYLGLGIVGLLFVFVGLTPWMLLGVLPFLVDLLLLPWFQVILMRKGLRKAGYVGRVRRVPVSELVERLLL